MIALANHTLLTPALFAVARPQRPGRRTAGRRSANIFASFTTATATGDRRLSAQLSEAVAALNRRGVVPLLLKGAVPLFLASDDRFSSRMTSDLDLAVEAAEEPLALACLAELGYGELEGDRGMARARDAGPVEIRRTARPAGVELPAMVDRAGLKVRIDRAHARALHWNSHDLIKEGTYVNSAGVRVQDTPGVVIEGWRISKSWDAIRVVGDSDDFTITNVWVSDSRDDAVENDDGLSGTISDSLFDGVMSGISLGDGDVDGSDNTVTFDGVLLRGKSFLYKGEITHGSPFKLDKGSPDITPDLRFHDTVVAIEDVDHSGQDRLAKAWDKTVASSGNFFLNLSDDPLPDDYPRPGAGWTVLQGQAARDHWNRERAEWISEHDGGGVDQVPGRRSPS